MDKTDISSTDFIEALGSLTGLIIQIHKDFKPIYITDAYAQLFGFSCTQEFMKLESIMELIPEKLHKTALERYRQTMVTGESEPMTIKTQRLNGEVIWLKVQDRRLSFKGEYCALTVMVDITEEVRLKEAFELAAENERRAREQLQLFQGIAIQNEKHEALTALLRGISHQLNTPLGNIQTSASILTDAANDTEKHQQNATLTVSALENTLQEVRDATYVIKRSVSKASSLIESVKQLVSDKNNGDICDFNLAKIVTDAVNMSLHAESINNIRLENKLDPSIVAFANPNDWVTVISVLANNVYHHAITEGESGNITVEGEYKDQHYIVRFSDDGVGIDESSHRKIFEAFYSTRLSQNNGIGLALAHSLVTRSLHGTIHVENNTSGTGASFVIRLPQKDYRPAGQ
ncbi:PAS domain-containing sensor histidine kinase [Reinekea marinisedimentorum]|uniref:histidine kinase n=1 Tax=Reinekea marinisedimentorum TaxID=230495 RepID=A0A4R3I417_9GAMM|nr:PAS domain-containing sensor histidine kinase [Reinekea marinisedimentorum]TCS40330.1 PAS domain S-box-containing protein [Reinekea marinisedimentorum]